MTLEKTLNFFDDTRRREGDFTIDPDSGLPQAVLISQPQELNEFLLGEHTLEIADAGKLAPEAVTPSDSSAIDPEKTPGHSDLHRIRLFLSSRDRL